MTRPPSHLELRPFESGFLGAEVYALLDPDAAQVAVSWARLADCGMLSCRVPAGGGKGLQSAGFRKIEELVTYACSLAESPAALCSENSSIRDATVVDVAACGEIAAQALRDDRFHADPLFPDDAADALKRAWIENSIGGRADRVLLSCTGGSVTGFNAVLARGDTAVIDLIAVAPTHHRQGVGRALVNAAIDAYAGTCKFLQVGTQDTNAGAAALYKATGFSEVARHETWHWHPNA